MRWQACLVQLCVQRIAIKSDASNRRSVALLTGEQVQKRRLSSTARSHDRQHTTRSHGGRDVVEYHLLLDLCPECGARLDRVGAVAKNELDHILVVPATPQRRLWVSMQLSRCVACAARASYLFAGPMASRKSRAALRLDRRVKRYEIVFGATGICGTSLPFTSTTTSTMDSDFVSSGGSRMAP